MSLTVRLALQAVLAPLVVEAKVRTGVNDAGLSKLPFGQSVVQAYCTVSPADEPAAFMVTLAVSPAQASCCKLPEILQASPALLEEPLLDVELLDMELLDIELPDELTEELTAELDEEVVDDESEEAVDETVDEAEDEVSDEEELSLELRLELDDDVCDDDEKPQSLSK